MFPMQAIIFSRKIYKTEWGPVYFLQSSVDCLIKFSYFVLNLFFSFYPGIPGAPGEGCVAICIFYYPAPGIPPYPTSLYT